MDHVEVTWGRALRVWWALVCGMVLSFLAILATFSLLLGLLHLYATRFASDPNYFSQTAGERFGILFAILLYGPLLPASIAVVRFTLKRKLGHFRLALIPVNQLDDKEIRLETLSTKESNQL